MIISRAKAYLVEDDAGIGDGELLRASGEVEKPKNAIGIGNLLIADTYGKPADFGDSYEDFGIAIVVRHRPSVIFFWH